MSESLKAHHRVAAIACAVALVATADFTAASIIRSATPFVGVTQHQFIQGLGDTTDAFTREVVVNILEIDTQAAGISFRMQDGNGSLPGEVTRTTTRAFTNSIGAQIGINVGFYDTNPPYPSPYTDLNFIAASNGNVYSTANGTEPLFNVSAANVPRIGSAAGAGTSTFGNGQTLYNATGGNQRILNGGAVSAPNDSYTNTLNPHTAIGVSQNQRYVYFATVDGRQTDYSEGMTTIELANIMKQFGAWNAINVDGGGSTTMVMDDSNDGVQNARLINSPSDGSSPSSPGTERVVGGSFAVFATPVASGYTPLAPITRPGVTGIKPLITTPTIFDDFEGTKGRFASAVNASGSSFNIAASSSSSVDSTESFTGDSSLKLNIVNTNAASARTQLRFLSGNGTPGNNVVDDKAMGNTGFVGVFLKMEPGNPNPLFVNFLIDDGTTTTNGTERGNFQQIIADGEWHLYQWDLTEDGPWTNFNAGNGVINGPNAFIDALYFSSSANTSGGPNFSGTVWIDTVAYNPNGRLDYLLPEPTSIAATLGLLGVMARRRR